MKSIIIASNCSGGGKTTFAMGLMEALKDKNLDVQGYKIGPDYIDTAFHKEVTNKSSRNLDVHLMGEEGVKYNYSKGSGDVGIIEGVMGLYDGIGASDKASTYDVSRILDDMPIILVMSPKGQSMTLCAEINGLKNFKNANIVGVILNSVSNKYYKLLKYSIENNCDIKVFGYIPKEEKLSLRSRHLGLVQSIEVLDIEEKVSLCAELIKEFVDIDEILSCMKEFKDNNENICRKSIKQLKRKDIKIGIALDKAFNFYYKNNLELLEALGEVIYFSPISDNKLPEELDFLYIGGGYPEVFKEELEINFSMRKSIKEALENGLKCYAECGGLMYLTNEIEDSRMVGFLDGKSFMGKSLTHFGYCAVSIKNKYFSRDIKINAHEFHKSYVILNEQKIYDVEKIQYDGEVLNWKCGYLKKNTLAGYAHINFLSNIDFLNELT